LIVVRDRAVELPEPGKRVAAMQKEQALIRLELDRLLVIPRRLCKIVLALIGNSARQERAVVRGIEPRGFVVIADGAIVVAFTVVIAAAAVKAHVILGIDPDRLVEVANGTVGIALLPIDCRAPGERERMVRIEAGRLIEVLDGAVGIAVGRLEAAARDKG